MLLHLHAIGNSLVLRYSIIEHSYIDQTSRLENFMYKKLSMGIVIINIGLWKRKPSFRWQLLPLFIVHFFLSPMRKN